MHKSNPHLYARLIILLFWGFLYVSSVYEYIGMFTTICCIVVFCLGVIWIFIKLFPIQIVFRLTNHCDTLSLRKKFEKLLRIVPKNSKENMTIDYCYILFWCGEYKESLSLLKTADIHRLESEKKFITKYLFYLFLYVQICIELGYYDESLGTLDTINSMIRVNIIPEAKIKSTKKDIVYLNHVIKLKQGNGQEAVEYFSRKLKFATDNISKISYTYYYAKALLLEDKLDEATKQFQFVIDNGKSLHLVELAKKDK